MDIIKSCSVCNTKFSTTQNRIDEGRGKYCSKKCYWKGKSGSIRDKKGIYESCKICGKQFYVFPYLVGKQKCCSSECFHKSRIGISLNCGIKKGDTAWNKGKSLSEEHKRKLSESHMGKTRPKKRLLNTCIVCKKEFIHHLSKSRKYCSGECYANGKINKSKIRIECGYRFIYMPDHPFAGKQSRKNYVQEHRVVCEKHLKRSIFEHEIIHHIDGDKLNNSPENLYVFNSNGEHLAFHSKVSRGESNLSDLKSNLPNL